MEKLTPDQARNLLNYVEKGGAARLGVIRSGRAATDELKMIREARRVVAEDEANKNT